MCYLLDILENTYMDIFLNNFCYKEKTGEKNATSLFILSRHYFSV